MPNNLFIMIILFEQKKLGRKRQSVQPVAMEIKGNPTTVRELIDATVRVCVEAFNRSASTAPDINNLDSDNTHHPLDKSVIDLIAETGRVAFGIIYNDRTEDPQNAVLNAIQCYEDGLFRMFINGLPLGDINDEIDLNEGDRLTIIRLTLLAGRLW